MGRWEPNSHGRLQRAALELYAEHGFEATTAAQIAARAGLSERTFFRHFADKREVLFGGTDALTTRLVAAVAGAPASEGVTAVARRAALTAAEFIGAVPREMVRDRRDVIATSPELRERDLAKIALVATALAAALTERGVSEALALVAADVVVSVLRVGLDQWLANPASPSLPQAVLAVWDEVRPSLG